MPYFGRKERDFLIKKGVRMPEIVWVILGFIIFLGLCKLYGGFLDAIDKQNETLENILSTLEEMKKEIEEINLNTEKESSELDFDFEGSR